MGEKKPLEGWASLLLDAAKSNPVSEVDEAQATKIYFDRIFEERRRKRPSAREKIPMFYAPRPAPINVSSVDVDESASEETRMAKARSIVRAKARSRFIQRQTNAIMDSEEMSEMERALITTMTPEGIEAEASEGEGTMTPKAISAVNSGGDDYARGGGLRESVDYVDFLRVRGMVSDKALPFLSSSTFIRFPRDHRGRISTPMFLEFVYHSLSLQKTHVSLQMYDMEGLGYLKGEDLQHFIFDHIPFIAALEGIPQNFYTFYVLTAVRRFLFFLDPKRTGKIPIDSLLRSHVMKEFIELRLADPNSGCEGISGNWFSAENIMKIYEEFVELDVDQNGLLSEEELLHFDCRQNVRLTPIVVQNLLKKGEMDYEAYIDLVVAMQNRETRQTLRYLWRVLDVEETGRLAFETIRRFYRDVAGILEEGGAEAPEVAYVENEIFDMVKPKDPAFITFSDLLASGVGSTVATMLVDANGFLLHEHRESFLNSPDEEALAASLSAMLSRPPATAPSATVAITAENTEIG